MEIRDITNFVAEQRDLVARHELEKLLIPIETAYPFVEREPVLSRRPDRDHRRPPPW